MSEPGCEADAGKLGVVTIGRNEGERFVRCLDSLPIPASRIVYVDSGSADDSVAIARARGVTVVELMQDRPFTAARARNAGYRALRDRWPAVEAVQFLDGDCELAPSWLECAASVLAERGDVGVVCGRRREQRRDANVYHRLCDMEWDTAIGETRSCGGDALMRTATFDAVGGFDDRLIAGEEPELCLRIRRAGWKVLRIDADMTVHDVDMRHFSQWWRRSVRGGFVVAEGIAMYGRDYPRRHALRSGMFWVVGWPLACVVAGLVASRWWPWPVAASVAFGAWLGGNALLFHRIRRHRLRHGDRPADASLYAGFCALGKVPELVGAARFLVSRIRGRRATLIEYKAPTAMPRRSGRGP